MAVEKITRALVNMMVTRALKGLQEDPERTMRNLVDLALTTTRGRFQRDLLEIAQMLLENQNSAYYTLAKDLVASVERKNLKTFGVNVCYEGCTLGARQIREREATLGFNIPWLLMFGTGSPRWNARLARAVQEAEELGVRVFLFLGKESLGQDCRAIYREHPQSAFVAMVRPGDLSEKRAAAAQEHDNLCVSLEEDGDPAAFERAAARLRDGRRLFSAHRYLRDGEAIANALGPAATQRLEQAECPLCLLIPTFRDPDSVQQLREGVRAFRMEQKHPVLYGDLLSDGIEIDRILSDDPFLAAFFENGQIKTSFGRGDGTVDLFSCTLLEALRRANR